MGTIIHIDQRQSLRQRYCELAIDQTEDISLWFARNPERGFFSIAIMSEDEGVLSVTFGHVKGIEFHAGDDGKVVMDLGNQVFALPNESAAIRVRGFLDNVTEGAA